MSITNIIIISAGDSYYKSGYIFVSMCLDSKNQKPHTTGQTAV